MLRKLLFVLAMLAASTGYALAAVDLNKADQAALDSVKGIGPKTSKAILDERKKGGEFKDWGDFQKRVKGVGDKSSDKLSQEGVTINGKPKATAGAKKETKVAAKEMKTESKAPAKEMKAAANTAAKDAKQEAKDMKK